MASTTIARWNLDGDALDSVGSHDGTLAGSPSFAAAIRHGIDGQSLALDGGSQQVDVADHAALKPAAWWVSAWGRDGIDSNGCFVFSKGNDDYYGFVYASGRVEAGFRNAAGTYVECKSEPAVVPTSGAVLRNRFDFVFVEGKLHVFLNRVRVAELATAEVPRTTTNPFRIGASGQSATSNWKGRLEKVELLLPDAATFEDEIADGFAEDTQIFIADDFEANDLGDEWSIDKEGEGADVTASTSEPITGTRSARAIVPGTASRAQLRKSEHYERIREGDELFFSFDFRLGEDLPTDPLAWGALLWQLQYEGVAESPVAALYFLDEPAHMSFRCGPSPGVPFAVLWEGPEVDTERHRAVIRVKVSNDPEVGFLEFWLDGEQQDLEGEPRVYRKTLPDGVSYDFLAMGYYRSTEIVGDGEVRLDNVSITRYQPDLVFPQTTILTGPDALTREQKASFALEASEAATFEARLDGGAWGSVAATFAIEVGVGVHTLEVRATDAAGNIDVTPAIYNWQVLAPVSHVPTPSGPVIPKLRVPLRVENGRLAVVEQDSQDNVAACVYAILSYERGSRLEDPDFGVESRLFDQMPIDIDEWLEQIAAYEPRASVQTQQEIEDLTGVIMVEVGLS